MAYRIQEECSGISVQHWPMGRRDPGLILKQSTAEAQGFLWQGSSSEAV
jgi:hypothetical protein